MSATTPKAPRRPSSNFPRSVPLAERVLAVENGQTMLAKSISEITSSVAHINQRMDAVDDWQTKMLVAEAVRIEQQKATDLVIAGLSAQLKRWNDNFSKVVWLVITPLLAGLPVAAAALYLFIRQQT